MGSFEDIGGTDFSTPTARIKPSVLNTNNDLLAGEIVTIQNNISAIIPKFTNTQFAKASSGSGSWTTLSSTSELTAANKCQSFLWELVLIVEPTGAASGSFQFLITYTDNTTDTVAVASRTTSSVSQSSKRGSHIDTSGKYIKKVELQFIVNSGTMTGFVSTNGSTDYSAGTWRDSSDFELAHSRNKSYITFIHL